MPVCDTGGESEKGKWLRSSKRRVFFRIEALSGVTGDSPWDQRPIDDKDANFGTNLAVNNFLFLKLETCRVLSTTLLKRNFYRDSSGKLKDTRAEVT